MMKERFRRAKKDWATIALVAVTVSLVYTVGFADIFATEYNRVFADPTSLPPPVLDKAAYNRSMLTLAHIYPPATTTMAVASSTGTSTPLTPFERATSTATTSVSVPGKLWPAPAAYPEVGALLPFNRIVAYYGNFYSTKMGVLGEYPTDEMLAMLASTTKFWAAADPKTPVIPAIDYIVVTAQGSAGFDGKYRARMPADQIQHAIDLANEVHGIVILDVQVGLSTLQEELPLLAPYLKLPQVHLAIDPEFSMKSGNKPGTVIGTFDATDVNYAATFLAALVQENKLPPKVLIVHRFTKPMVTRVSQIRPLPEVQIVVDMDGWGDPAKKIGTYTNVVAPEPVQFTGFKLFYKNDLKPPSTRMLTPEEVLGLTPAPSFIQYQ